MGHPLCTQAQPSAQRRCLQSHKIGVVPAPGGAAVLRTTRILNRCNGKGRGRRRTRGSSLCSWGSAAEVSCHRCCSIQLLVILASSGTACSRDAVAVSTRYLSPAYCWHSVFSLRLFLGTKRMFCPRLELKILQCAFTSLCHWQAWEESHRLILQNHFSGVERDRSIFRSAKCWQRPAWSTWAPENHSKAETIRNR